LTAVFKLDVHLTKRNDRLVRVRLYCCVLHVVLTVVINKTVNVFAVTAFSVLIYDKKE